MRLRRTLLFTLLPLFASCQVYTGKPVDEQAAMTRMQGQLNFNGEQLIFTPCGEKRQFVISNAGASTLLSDAKRLRADGASTLQVDMRGLLGSGDSNDGSFKLDTLYRLQSEGKLCDDLAYRLTKVRASGHEPDWNIGVSPEGMILERIGQKALVLPYLEEQLPEGRMSISSEANGDRVELWVTPQHCVDSMSGAVSHLSAELRVNGQVMRGCGYFGGAQQ
ncbi:MULTISPECIES: COG3650 family protein [Pseudomonas]|uniref:Putative lipoprotein n=1 Tax=Pseudomonas segetis TaxID=298908 RepID=A0A239CAQ4_9PSED|nr:MULTISPECIES: membrane protein [Pseudomonas]SNS17316.1 putative lipoprotein [Pseudomonas segetis]